MSITIITACGSGKFRTLIHEITDGLSNSGFVVLPPPLPDIEGMAANSPSDLRLLAWKGATFAHLARIQKASVCIMVNPNGYLGPSSTLELGYAVSLGRLIVALEHDQAEASREGLFDIVLGTVDVDRIVEKISGLLGRKA